MSTTVIPMNQPCNPLIPNTELKANRQNPPCSHSHSLPKSPTPCSTTPCSTTPCLPMVPTFQGGDVCPQINSWRPGGEESRTELLPAYTGETGPQLGHSHCRTPTVALLPLPLLTHKHTRRKHPARNALTETDTHSLIHTYIHKQTVHLPAHISLEM